MLNKIPSTYALKRRMSIVPEKWRQEDGFIVLHLTNFLIGLLTFYASFESKNPLYKLHASINKPWLCRDSAGHFI